MDNSHDYRLDLENCPVPVALVDADGLIVRSNTQCNELFGYDPDELTGQAVEVLVPRDVRAQHPQLRSVFTDMPVKRHMGAGRELFGLHKSGELVPVEIGLDPIDMGADKLVMVSILDIRDRKTSETRLRAALNAAASAMIQVSDQGIIEFVNLEAVRMFDFTEAELMGKPIEVLIPAALRNKHRVYRTSYQSRPMSRPMGADRELFGQRKDGSEFPVEIGLTPIQHGSRWSTMATVLDVTERKQREQVIQQQNRQLGDLNRELLEFAYAASHDLKSPLSTIGGLLECCTMDLEAGEVEEVGDNITRARNLAAQLAERIENTLRLAKSDVSENRWESVTLAARIRKAWDCLDDEHVTLTVDCQPDLQMVTVPARFDIVIGNLLDNAVKYRDPQRNDCLVCVHVDSTRDAVLLTVSDNGVGIPEERRAHLFSPLRRSSVGKSTGIGLGLVKKQMGYLGGSIELDSATDQTTFRLAFPKPVVDSATSGVLTP